MKDKLWSMKCRDCGGSGKRDEKPNFITGSIKPICLTCHRSGKMELVMECDTSALRHFRHGEELREALPYMDLGTRFIYHETIHKVIDTKYGQRASCKVDKYRPLTVAEAEEILLTSEKYEGACVGITAKQMGIMGINNLIETYLNIKDNPLTSLTYKGQPVTLRAKGE